MNAAYDLALKALEANSERIRHLITDATSPDRVASEDLVLTALLRHELDLVQLAAKYVPEP